MTPTVVALCSVAAEPVAARLVTGLTGRRADSILGPTDRDARRVLSSADLVVIAVAVSDGSADPPLVRLLSRCDLTGATVFVAAVGAWPEESTTAARDVLPVIRRAGGSCLAPVLQTAGGASSAIAAFCHYWRPAVSGLIAARRRVVA